MSLPSIVEATQRMLERTTPLAGTRVPIEGALGCVLSEDIFAQWDLPGTDVSIMDGFAVRAADLLGHDGRFVELVRSGESAAGHPSSRPVAPGEAVRISTGAVLPVGADAVVPQEDTRVEGSKIVVDRNAYGSPAPGRWVRTRGSDIECGARLLTAGLRINPSDLAAGVAAGVRSVMVHRAPIVAICSTGDELVPPGHDLGPGQIISSNAPMLLALVEAAGGRAIDLGIVSDQPGALREVLARGLSADVLITSGGISVGDHDLVAEALAELGCEFHVRGVALKPGKPTSYATQAERHVFALPGNPASSWVAFWLFVRPVLRRLCGVRGSVLPQTVSVVLREPASHAGSRTHCLRARLHHDGTATPLEDQRSGSLTSLTDVDALIVVPAGAPSLNAGERADALVVDPWWTERRSS